MTDRVMNEEAEIQPTAQEQESLEQAALDAAVREGKGAAGSGATAAAETVVEAAPEAAPEAETPPPPPPFIGDYTAEQVLALLKKAEGLNLADVETRLSRSLSGHLGPLGARLKALEESSLRDAEWDETALAGLKDIDEGIYEALRGALPKALKIKRSDPEGLVRPHIDSYLAQYDGYQRAAQHDFRQEIILETAVPDYEELAKRPEMDAFIDGLGEEDFKVLQAWYQPGVEKPQLGLKNGRAVARIFRDFSTSLKAAEEAEAKKANALKAAARPAGGSRVAGAAMTAGRTAEEIEQAALERELNRRG